MNKQIYSLIIWAISCHKSPTVSVNSDCYIKVFHTSVLNKVNALLG